jgi:hypothetical protein
MLSGMKKILTTILTALALTMLASCGAGEPAGTGVYELDAKAMEAQMLEGAPEAAKPMIKKMAEGMKGTMTLKADGSAEMSMMMPNPMGGEAKEDKTTGTWKLEGDKMTIVAKEDGKDDARTLTYKDGTLTLVEQQGGKEMTMTFKKKAK